MTSPPDNRGGGAWGSFSGANCEEVSARAGLRGFRVALAGGGQRWATTNGCASVIPDKDPPSEQSVAHSANHLSTRNICRITGQRFLVHFVWMRRGGRGNMLPHDTTAAAAVGVVPPAAPERLPNDPCAKQMSEGGISLPI